MSQIEEKLDIIDEKLAELKLTKEVPDFSFLFALLSGFNWSREWFNSVEEVLLALAFRGESDKPILDFIRRRIISTDVITFNREFLQFHRWHAIPNHYELILKRPDHAEHIFRNTNTAIIDAVIKYHLDLNIVSGRLLSMSNNDQVLDYLFLNPKRIDFDVLIYNTAPKAAKYCIANNKICAKILCEINDDEIVEYLIDNYHLISFDILTANPNNKAVDFLWNHPRKSIRHLSMNSNDRVVDYLLKNPHMMDFRKLSLNGNKKIVEFLMANPDKINKHCFVKNDAEAEVAKYIIDKINSDAKNVDMAVYLYTNSSDIAADYIIKNIANIKSHWISYNSNDRVMGLVMMTRNGTSQIAPYTNTCEYNWQKLEAFNAAGMFPRLPHLRL